VIALEHLEVREQMVPEGHRLGDLQVGESRHHGSGVPLRPIEQRLLKRPDEPGDVVDRVAQPQAQVGGDLVVARARGVKRLPGCPRCRSGAARC